MDCCIVSAVFIATPCFNHIDVSVFYFPNNRSVILIAISIVSIHYITRAQINILYSLSFGFCPGFDPCSKETITDKFCKAYT